MPSPALDGLLKGVREVDHLLQGDPTPPGGISPRPDITRVIARASVVLLCSHYERYLRSVVDDAVSAVNSAPVTAERLTTKLRLRHSLAATERLIAKEWVQRAESLAQFIASEAWLWGGTPQASLSARSLVSWMKAPTPENVVKLYRLWGIADIFVFVTRTDHTRRRLRLHLQALVEKRNNIAHGDFAVEATRGDVEEYRDTVATFCKRSDRALARVLHNHVGVPSPW